MPYRLRHRRRRFSPLQDRIVFEPLLRNVQHVCHFAKDMHVKTQCQRGQTQMNVPTFKAGGYVTGGAGCHYQLMAWNGVGFLYHGRTPGAKYDGLPQRQMRIIII
jgi:hypothetical protein